MVNPIVVSFDFPGMLAYLTGDTRPKGWKEESGPESGCGVDYWYHHRSYGLVYINVDQDWIKISLCRDDTVLFEGTSEACGKFVATKPLRKR